jgi:hypothetical protein
MEHLGLKYRRLILVETLDLDLEHTTMEFFVEVVQVDLQTRKLGMDHRGQK